MLGPLIGNRITRFEITAKLGEGGMSEVWRARDTPSDPAPAHPQAAAKTEGRSKQSCVAVLGTGCLLTLLVVLAIAALVVVAYFVFQRSQAAVAEEAERFVLLVSEGRHEAAYESTATILRRNVALEAFKEQARGAPLGGMESLEWTKREISKDASLLEARLEAGRQGIDAGMDAVDVTASAELTGIVTRSDGSPVEVVVTLAKEEGDWRVSDLNWSIPAAGSGIEWRAAREADLTPSQLESLARSTLVRLGRAKSSEQIRELHETTGTGFRSAMTVAQLETALREIQDSVPFDLSEVGSATLVLDPPPVVSTDGRYLRLIGRAELPLGAAKFELVYEREEDDWLLLKANIEGASPT